MYNILIARAKAHVSSFSMTILSIVWYMNTDGTWLDGYLPLEGKPAIVFILILIVVSFEINVYNNRETNKKIDSNNKALNTKLDDMIYDIKVDNLKQAVNAIYNRFKDSEDEFITSENLIKEINELKDKREQLAVNSYTQFNLNFLCNNIKRV